MLCITVWFVYTNIYQTIGKAESLFMLEGNMQTEPINFKLVHETNLAWDEKQLSRNFSFIRDPFVVTTSTIPANNVTTTPAEKTPSPLSPSSPQL